MKTDEDIERERLAMLPVVGPTHAEWYAEACRVEYDDPAALWACRARMLAYTLNRDLGALADAARKLLHACSRLEECGGQRVCDAMDAVEKALWWQEKSDA